MMDREKKDELPKMQLSFIDEICLPLYKVGIHFRNCIINCLANLSSTKFMHMYVHYKVLSETFPWLQPLYDGASRNRRNWQDLAEKVDMGLTWIDYDVIEKPVEEFTSK